jgi:hypothetical protein
LVSVDGERLVLQSTVGSKSFRGFGFEFTGYHLIVTCEHLLEMNPQYLAGLTPAQRLLQQRAIRQSQREYKDTGMVTERPKVSGAKTPRSKHAVNFERKYGFSVTDLPKVRKQFPTADIEGILAKGAAAYASSGSRPNVSPFAWKFARLASALTGGPAAKVDKDLL